MLERPYGWGWLLTLAYELETWDDPDGRRWSSALAPLADLLTPNLVGWLPRLTYAQRTGVHPNTAFALSRCLDYANFVPSMGTTRFSPRSGPRPIAGSSTTRITRLTTGRPVPTPLWNVMRKRPYPTSRAAMIWSSTGWRHTRRCS
jgi:hypothetical protein